MKGMIQREVGSTGAPAQTEPGGIGDWLRERLGSTSLEVLLAKKTVPIHRHSLWYYLGGMTLFLFTIQVSTGILLLLYYRPSAEEAFESVQFIMTDVSFGWLVRSIHSWSANLMIATLFVHMFSVYFLKAYRKPRECTWVTGVLLLFLSLAFGFSGYLLPWNSLAFFATRVGTEIPRVIPGVGEFFMRFLRGGDEVTGATLTRFFGFHVAILPALTTLVLGLHIWLVQFHGMSRPLKEDRQQPREMKFFRTFSCATPWVGSSRLHSWLPWPRSSHGNWGIRPIPLHPPLRASDQSGSFCSPSRRSSCSPPTSSSLKARWWESWPFQPEHCSGCWSPSSIEERHGVSRAPFLL